ncbi:MAG: LemA family protein, partial [Ferruginibacter sp.]
MVTYNGLVKKQEKVKLQWNEVQNAYQRRIDLVPNLVNVVKGGAQ